MSGIIISPERVDQVTATAHKWNNSFTRANAIEEHKQEFLSIFDPKVKWADHAFEVRREGQEAVWGLLKAFTHANQPFKSELKRVDVTPFGAWTELVWSGCLSNDIVRPDGEVAVKATGKEFVTHVSIRLEINAEGKITRLDEFYNKHWDDGISESKYKVITGASMKRD